VQGVKLALGARPTEQHLHAKQHEQDGQHALAWLVQGNEKIARVRGDKVRRLLELLECDTYVWVGATSGSWAWPPGEPAQRLLQACDTMSLER
jgi:hypothetical protein